MIPVGAVVIKKIQPAFTDERGTITDIIENEVKHIGIISSKINSVRGRHYHKKSTQFMYMIKGSIVMKTRGINEKNSEVETTVIGEGDFITIPPEVIHSFTALEDSLFLDMTTESRANDGYEEDTVRAEI